VKIQTLIQSAVFDTFSTALQTRPQVLSTFKLAATAIRQQNRLLHATAFLRYVPGTMRGAWEGASQTTIMDRIDNLTATAITPLFVGAEQRNLYMPLEAQRVSSTYGGVPLGVDWATLDEHRAVASEAVICADVRISEPLIDPLVFPSTARYLVLAGPVFNATVTTLDVNDNTPSGTLDLSRNARFSAYTYNIAAAVATARANVSSLGVLLDEYSVLGAVVNAVPGARAPKRSRQADDNCHCGDSVIPQAPHPAHPHMQYPPSCRRQWAPSMVQRL